MAAFKYVKPYSLLLLIAFSFIFGVNGDRVAEKIYKVIDDGFSCFRRLNATHHIGCTSSQSGNVGVVHLARNDSDMSWLLSLGPHAPYVVLMKPTLFNKETIVKLKQSGKVSGIVILNETETSRPVHSSPELSCPNKYIGLYRNESKSYCDSKPWNPHGDGLLYEDIGIPIFFLNITEAYKKLLLDDCFYKFNQPKNGEPPSYPLCSIELKSFMWAAVNTPTCLRRGKLNAWLNPEAFEYCDPLSSANLHVPLLASNKSEGPLRNRSVIFITARMDSASLFENLSPGADSVVTGMVTLLAVAELLFKLRSSIAVSSNIENVYFVFFNGESFDYIGSSRMVYDMTNKNFPHPLNNNTLFQAQLVSLEHIKYFIELGQLAPYNDPTLYIHSDYQSISDESVNNEVNEIISALKQNAEGLDITRVNETVPLPPASLQSFLRKDKAIPGVYISNHDAAFQNRFYNSEWDTAANVQFDRDRNKLTSHLSKITRLIAAVILQLSNVQVPRNLTANSTLIEDMLDCYLLDSDCTLFRRLLNRGPNPISYLLPTYVGVNNRDNLASLSFRTRHLLALVTGEILQQNKTSCKGDEADEIYHYYWMGDDPLENRTGYCLKSTVRSSLAISPAFIIQNYDWNSGEYSSWSESRWQGFSMRIFLKPSFSQEIAVFIVGLIILLISFLIVEWTNRHASGIFGSRSETASS